jgi:hypothetical protein
LVVPVPHFFSDVLPLMGILSCVAYSIRLVVSSSCVTLAACANLQLATALGQSVSMEYPVRALGLPAALGICDDDRAMVEELGGVIVDESADYFTAEFDASACPGKWGEKVVEVQAYRARVPANTRIRDVNIASQTELSRLANRSLLDELAVEPFDEADTCERECSSIL